MEILTLIPRNIGRYRRVGVLYLQTTVKLSIEGVPTEGGDAIIARGGSNLMGGDTRGSSYSSILGVGWMISGLADDPNRFDHGEDRIRGVDGCLHHR